MWTRWVHQNSYSKWKKLPDVLIFYTHILGTTLSFIGSDWAISTAKQWGFSRPKVVNFTGSCLATKTTPTGSRPSITSKIGSFGKCCFIQPQSCQLFLDLDFEVIVEVSGCFRELPIPDEFAQIFSAWLVSGVDMIYIYIYTNIMCSLYIYIYYVTC